MMTRIKRRKMSSGKSFSKSVPKKRKRGFIMEVLCLLMELSQEVMELQDLQAYLPEDKVT